MSLSPIFQRDLFGSDAGLSGWPSDGLDDPSPGPGPAPGAVADLRASPARALRVVLGRAPSHPPPDLPAAAVTSPPATEPGA